LIARMCAAACCDFSTSPLAEIETASVVSVMEASHAFHYSTGAPYAAPACCCAAWAEFGAAACLPGTLDISWQFAVGCSSGSNARIILASPQPLRNKPAKAGLPYSHTASLAIQATEAAIPGLGPPAGRRLANLLD
jgi:hypothetical protein